MLFINFDWLNTIEEYEKRNPEFKVLQWPSLDCLFLFSDNNKVKEINELYYMSFSEYQRRISYYLRNKMLTDKTSFIKVYDSDTGKTQLVNLLKLIDMVKANEFSNIKYKDYRLYFSDTQINVAKMLYKTKHFYMYIADNQKNVYIWYDTNDLFYIDDICWYFYFQGDKVNVMSIVERNKLMAYGIKVYGNQLKFTSYQDKDKTYVNFRVHYDCKKISSNIDKATFMKWIKIGKFEIMKKI